MIVNLVLMKMKTSPRLRKRSEKHPFNYGNSPPNIPLTTENGDVACLLNLELFRMIRLCNRILRFRHKKIKPISFKRL